MKGVSSVKYFIGGVISSVFNIMCFVLGLFTGYALFGENHSHYSGRRRPGSIDFYKNFNERVQEEA